MALVVPTVAEFETFKGEEFAPEEVERVQLFLDMAATLIELRLGITSVTPGSALEKLVRWAIMDLAWYLGTSMEDRDAMFSPFSSERIGSYSYSKAGGAAADRRHLGVPFFDMLLDALTEADLLLEAASMSWTSSSKVFSTDVVALERGLHPDPYWAMVRRIEDPSPIEGTTL